jgi:hypothetical protein
MSVFERQRSSFMLSDIERQVMQGHLKKMPLIWPLIRVSGL